MSFPWLQFLLLLASFALGTSVDLTCPTSPINVNTSTTGSFPAGGGLTNFPNGYNCSIRFDIPVGFVVKFDVETTAFGGPGDDSIVIYDSLSVPYDLNVGRTTFYSPANTSTVTITTYTNNSAFYFTWEYKYVGLFGQFKNPTGSTMKMTLLPNYYYLFTSARGPITFHTANIQQQKDTWLSSIYVYDGSSLNAPYMGNLLQLSRDSWKTSGRFMVLVNYYNDTGNSYGIANDYEAISGYTEYNFWLLTSSQAASVQLGAPSSTSVAATYLCIDSNEVYITSMSVSQNGQTIPQMVTFQPLTPTDHQSVMLEYTPNQQISQYLPQQIPGRLFTMFATGCTVSADFVSGAFADWSRAYPGRKGSIFSPSIWDPQSSASYVTSFTSSDVQTFTFNLESVVIAVAGENIRIEVGSPNSNPLVTEFSKTSRNVGSRAANGTYMSTVFTGTSAQSSFWLLFEIESTSPSTTSSPLITTTKASSSILNAYVLILTILKALMN